METGKEESISPLKEFAETRGFAKGRKKGL